MTAALSRRVSDLPPLARLAAKARRDYGDAPPSRNYTVLDEAAIPHTRR